MAEHYLDGSQPDFAKASVAELCGGSGFLDSRIS